ncbi:MAG: GMC family oxidoreductase [Hyphomicrobiaceae bacterium]
MSRLARPVAQAKATYDVVVVGSGYGGGVAASRLARIGLKVAVLERGREYLPGAFAETLLAASTAMQINGKGRQIGAPDALFDLRVGKDVHALVGCGLGGTSLINANVCLTPDVMVLEDEAWPEEIRIDHRLNVGFHRARQMLSPEPLPLSVTPTKLASLDRASQAIGHHVERVPLHVAFHEKTNAAGVIQPACTYCGDCMSGCNVGAKTTVHSTYLTDAVNHGAELFTGAHVRLVERSGSDLWRVVFRRIGDKDSHVPVGAVTAAMVVLAAGTLGTAEIMMRSRENGLRVSDRLGWRFSTNADVMSFGYGYDKPVNSVGIGRSGKARVAPPGPAVVGLIDLRRRRDPLDRMALVEATVPSVVARLMPMLLATGATLAPEEAGGGLAGLLADVRRNAESFFAGAYQGPVHHSHAFLAVGHDGAAGRILYEDDTAAIHWPDAGDEPVFTHISAMLRKGVAANGGTYVPNPVSSKWLGGDLMTVHPLGGCAMGRDRDSGVVDHKGRVFDGDPTRRADAVHDGLFICDGSVIPRSLGVHPLFTITAIAERAMMLFAREHGLALDVTPRVDAPKRDFRAELTTNGGATSRVGRLLGRAASA